MAPKQGYRMYRIVTAITVAATTASFATAQTAVEGLYYPSSASVSYWSCRSDRIGQEGGALSIGGGYLDGVENRCALTDPVAGANGNSIRYTAICSAEGETYSEPLTITKTASGVAIERNGRTVFWSACPSQTASIADPRNEWRIGFAMGVSEVGTSDTLGNSITFSCSGGFDGRLYVELDGAPARGGDITFEVDGNRYGFPVWAEGGRVNVECEACKTNYAALWNAVRAGNRLTISQDGQQAAFGLAGSSAALDAVPCEPEESW